jgi:hypothetical protein
MIDYEVKNYEIVLDEIFERGMKELEEILNVSLIENEDEISSVPLSLSSKEIHTISKPSQHELDDIEIILNNLISINNPSNLVNKYPSTEQFLQKYAW